MPPTRLQAEVLAAGAGASAVFVAQHLERMGVRYAAAFGAAEIASHVRSLSKLDADTPVATEVPALGLGVCVGIVAPEGRTV